MKLRELIAKAVDILSVEAESLRKCHTLGPDHDDWTGEEAAKHDHDEMIEVATGLRNKSPAIADLIEGAEKVRTLASGRYENDEQHRAALFEILCTTDAALLALNDE